jgi:hypothetical protein
LYEQEEVEEDKARAFAKEIDAVFKSTSAKNASGIDVWIDLFNFFKKLNFYLGPLQSDW